MKGDLPFWRKALRAFVRSKEISQSLNSVLHISIMPCKGHSRHHMPPRVKRVGVSTLILSLTFYIAAIVTGIHFPVVQPNQNHKTMCL